MALIRVMALFAAPLLLVGCDDPHGDYDASREAAADGLEARAAERTIPYHVEEQAFDAQADRTSGYKAKEARDWADVKRQQIDEVTGRASDGSSSIRGTLGTPAE